MTSPPLTGTPAVRLPGRIALVPSTKLAAKLAQLQQQGKYVPGEAELVAEINKLNVDGGVPATMDKWFRIYVHRHLVGLRQSGKGDAWMIEFVAPLTLSDHERMARGTLRLHARGGWIYERALPQVRAGCHTFAREITDAWQSLVAVATDTSTPPARRAHHDAFCDALEEVIDAARQIEMETGRRTPPMPYRAVESAGGQRRGTSGVYVFRLVNPARLAPGTFVEVRGVPDLLGWVKAQEGDAVTVGFTGSVHRPRIPPQGELAVSVNVRIQQIQEDAVTALRTGRVPNPRLLPLLAGGALPAVMPTVAPVGATASVTPRLRLDPDQRIALQRALAGPDLLLVLGPPGTGKTRTIGEIVRACVARGERVLVSSQTHVAVDNVLQRLSGDVRAVRVGGEDRVSQSVQHLLVPNLADSVRAEVLSRTAARMELLAAWQEQDGPATGWRGRLDGALTDAGRAGDSRAQAAADLDAASDAVEAAHAPARHAAAAAMDAASAHSQSLEARRAALSTRLTRARARETGLFGAFHRRRARETAERLTTTENDARDAADAFVEAQRALADADHALAEARRTDPAVRHAQARVETAEGLAQHSLAEAGRAAAALHRLLAPHVLLPAPGPGLAQLEQFQREATRLGGLLGRQAALLSRWRQQLELADESLHHELVRYADVVGSTCIGVGVRRNLIADQTFDVAIVDEAGQISLPSTVVPLVRARRAILVGDHHQLPPIVDHDAKKWLAQRPAGGRGSDAAVLTDLLTTSAFERLHRAGGAPHTVVLTRQRRMPAVVGDFVRDWFYDGNLSTHVTRTPPAGLFASCLALVDTGDQPPRARAERPLRQSESWRVAGYDNPAEARVIIDLVQWSVGTGLSWGVIVPYQAQAQYLRARLAGELGDPQVLKDCLGTVDAFQGGERDIILFGFTRSNSAGKVGFLAELRRLNVAMTRARQQLVLVGDFTMLRGARDDRFAAIARALYAHAQRDGDVQHSTAVRSRLRQLRSGQR